MNVRSLAAGGGRVASTAARFWFRGLLVVSSAVAGAAGGHTLSETVTSQSAIVEVRASIDRGSTFRLYYNNVWSEPQSAAIQPGTSTTYRFTVPSRLTALRFDPSDELGANVLLQNIVVTSPAASAQVPTDQVDAWLGNGLEISEDPAAGAMRITVRQRAGYMMRSVDVDLSRQVHPLLKRFRLNATTLLWCGLLLAVGLLLLSIQLWDVPVAVGVLAIMLASLALAAYVAPRVLTWPAPYPDVTLTVGHESYFGRPKAADFRAINVATAAAALSALVLGWCLRRLVVSSQYPPANADGAHRSIRGDVLFVAACMAAFAIASVPPAAMLFHAAPAAHHGVDFDSQSSLAWQYLNAKGSLPWRDYWFPYSGLYDQMGPVYPDFTLRWLHSILLFAVVLTSGLIVMGRSRTATIALCCIWLYLESMAVVTPGVGVRYFLNVSVVLLSAVALSHRALWPSALFGVWGAYVLHQEVSQAVYAVPALGLIAGVPLIFSSPQQRRALFGKLVVAAAAMGIAVAVYVVSLARHGQLGQWWEFVTTVDVMSNYSSWPADVVSWFAIPATLDQFLVFLTLVLLVGGTLQALWTRGRDLFLLVPLALGIVSVMLLQKQVVRPGSEAQVLTIPIMGIALLVVQQLRLRPLPVRYAAWSAFAAALLATCFTWSMATNRERVWAYVDVTSGLTSDLRYALAAADEWKPVREAYFSPATGTFSPMPATEFVATVQRLTNMGPNDSIFVLGDSSDLYLLLRRPLPFYVSLYNQSPLFSQQKTIAWLREHEPKFLFWNPQDQVFDAVPNMVRVPLLYNDAAANFVRLGTVARFDVLRRRLPGEPPDLAYWREKLGASIDLGYIPATSRALQEQDEHGRYAMRYVVVRVPSPQEGQTYSVSLGLAGGPYVVQFKGRRNVGEYAIALDRLPFAEAADNLGRAPVVTATEGIAATIKTLRFATDRLY